MFAYEYACCRWTGGRARISSRLQARGREAGMSLSTIDLVVIVLYAIGIFGLAQWVSREKAGHAKDTSDYFLASKNLPWWAIGSSLIAANISAEQIVGMSGSGYAIGLAIASYEWMAALNLRIVGKLFLPDPREKGAPDHRRGHMEHAHKAAGIC